MLILYHEGKYFRAYGCRAAFFRALHAGLITQFHKQLATVANTNRYVSSLLKKFSMQNSLFVV
jgi:hypothetical protein